MAHPHGSAQGQTMIMTGRLALLDILRRQAKDRSGMTAGMRWASVTAYRAKGSFAPRHGKAVEPAVWEQRQQRAEGQEPNGNPPRHAKTRAPTQNQPTRLKAAQQTRQPGPAPVAEPQPADSAERQPRPRHQSPRSEAPLPAAVGATADCALASENDAGGPATVKDGDGTREPKKPVSPQAVLVGQPPFRVAARHPPLPTPPYVHHFDSYSLVKQLQGGGYSQEQATTAMKAIRTLLAQNLDVAQQNLVSKSDVENETYLFRAACAELRTEIKNNRRLQDEQSRQQRTLLQHEVEILTQTLNQELLTLTDNVRGMFNDRRMAVREEHKSIEGAIQKITYKMSILLSSDCKSEIEGVRWILIRRSVLGIIFMAMLTLGTLRLHDLRGPAGQAGGGAPAAAAANQERRLAIRSPLLPPLPLSHGPGLGAHATGGSGRRRRRRSGPSRAPAARDVRPCPEAHTGRRPRPVRPRGLLPDAGRPRRPHPRPGARPDGRQAGRQVRARVREHLRSAPGGGAPQRARGPRRRRQRAPHLGTRRRRRRGTDATASPSTRRRARRPYGRRSRAAPVASQRPPADAAGPEQPARPPRPCSARRPRLPSRPPRRRPRRRPGRKRRPRPRCCPAGPRRPRSSRRRHTLNCPPLPGHAARRRSSSPRLRPLVPPRPSSPFIQPYSCTRAQKSTRLAGPGENLVSLRPIRVMVLPSSLMPIVLLS